MIRKAKKSEHNKILNVAKQSPHTSAFGHMMFSGEAAYEKGWIRVFTRPRKGILGFTCVRHKVRSPETSLYFIGVDKDAQHSGIGEQLLEDLKAQAPHNRIILNVMKNNDQARAFYKKHGFKIINNDALKGKGVQLALEWEDE